MTELRVDTLKSVAEHTKALQDNKVLRETLQTQETRNLKQRDLVLYASVALLVFLTYKRHSAPQGDQ